MRHAIPSLALVFSLFGPCGAAPSHAAPQPAIRLAVDASEAPRHLYHAVETVPASPGPLTLVYPKWIPGEHEPSGPIEDLAGLRLRAGAAPLAWSRDPTDMYAFHCVVPDGVSSVEIALDYLSPVTIDSGFVNGHNANSTDRLAVLSWNTVALYPAGSSPTSLQVEATLRIPDGWTYATALETAHTDGAKIAFASVSLETLVDSPVLAGRFMRTIDLTPGATPDHLLDLAADDPAALDARPQIVDGLRRLTGETVAVFGPGHYRRYHFLLVLSDHMVYYGLEHHESSDNRIAERTLIDDPSPDWPVLLPHEFVHSWNGKYRRPDGLATADFQQPMRDDLLWVYEGLTEYYSWVLGARCGLMSAEWFRDAVASNASYLGGESGRAWRSLEDVAVSSQILEPAPRVWTSRRRSLDYYPEGFLLWLEVDAIIRSESAGVRSLDDFARAFFGGAERTPVVRPYALDDVVAALGRVAPYDWRGFFAARVDRTVEGVPTAGIEADGWRLAYTAEPTPFSPPGFDDSLGLSVSADGDVADVRTGSPADRAGVGAGMKIVGVGGRRFTTERLHEAISRSQGSTEPIELLAENGDFFRTFRVDFHGEERHPHLVRVEGKPDVFEALLAPHAK